MNNNPIDELRHMQVPVSEHEWESIVSDKRYLKKFGQKPGLSPKGRAALIAGVATLLVAVPILVKTLTHKAPDTAQDKQSVTVVVDSPKVADNNTSAVTIPETHTSAHAHPSEATPQSPSVNKAAVQAATNELSSLTAITEARVPENSQPVLTSTPETTPPATLPSGNSPTAPHEKKVNATVTENIANRPVVSDNTPQTEDIIPEEEFPTFEKSQVEPEADVEELFVPSAFSPNGDNLNDYFFVKANFTPRDFEMRILSRRGDMVFHARNIDSQWDGKLNGTVLPGDVYICLISYIDRNGNLKKEKKQVLLLK